MISTAIMLVLPAAALAAEVADDREPIIVTGSDEGYVPVVTTTATKTPTPLLDVPQSVSVVTREQIDDQAMRSIADVVRYVPGVTIGQGEGHRDQLTIRGNNSTADFFVDGIRDDVQYYRGLYNAERVEVLKGPNAMIFGRGGGGGVINRVSKSPVQAAFAGGNVSVDTFGAWYIDTDINQPIGENAAARLNAVYEEFNNHRDAYGGHRVAINPTVAFALGEATKIGFSYEYAKDERVIDRGVPSLSDGVAATVDRPLSGFRDAFFGVRGVNQSDFKAHVAKAQLEHSFSDNLTLNSKLLYGDYDKVYQNAFPATAVTVNAVTGARTLGIEAYRDPTRRKNLFSQTDLVLKAKTGGIEHVLLAGAEYGDQSTRNERINGFFDNVLPHASGDRRRTVSLADPLVVPPIFFIPGATGNSNRKVRSEAEVLAAYLQDQISIGEHFDVVGGIRYDRFKLRVDNLLASPATSFTRTDDLWSPRAGLIFKPIEPVSIYASYSKSYLPQSGDQFLSLDVTAANLKPEKFENYELGLKWNLRPALTLTAAIYQLDRSNTRAPGAVAGTVVLTGEQRSKGLEVGLVGQLLDNWQISAGYTLQEAEIRKTTSAAPAGRNVAQVPKHQFSLWNRYDLSDQIGLGLGVYHQSKSFASISNAVELPSFTRVDAAMFFKVSETIEAQVNIENLLGETYYPTAHTDNNITTGAPTSARFTIRTRF